jgi:SAM-dependent methyltransferase
MILYDQLADWWPLFSHPDDYAEEAAAYVRLLGDVREVLELGSGGGNNASHMKRHFQLTLVEPSPGMREVSRALNPECAHLPGDMRTVRLGRTFDAVFVHDAVCYLLTEEDLRAAMETMAIHLRPGGVALVVPDETVESFVPSTDHGGHDAADGRGVRYLEWKLPQGAAQTETHYAILLREASGATQVVHDRHLHGLFSTETWLRLFDSVGLDAAVAERHLSDGDFPAFLAKKR